MKLSNVIEVESNIWMLMRERGKKVPGSTREGHNVFTLTGRNLLSKLMGWQTVAGTDLAYTHRRIRWVGVGIGTQLEVTTVSQLNQATLSTGSNYLVPVDAPSTFPTSSSIQFSYEFGTSEISIGGVPVSVSEAGMFADVNPAASAGVEDVEVGGGILTTLNPALATNPPVVYKAFEPLVKTVDFTFEIRWIFRF